jgi:hypothetical protein
MNFQRKLFSFDPKLAIVPGVADDRRARSQISCSVAVSVFPTMLPYACTASRMGLSETSARVAP